VPPDSLRARALSELSDLELEELAAHGEDSLVERKREPPAANRFGAAVASFANTPGGGWVLIGVDDDGVAHGYEGVPAKTDLQSHLGDLLRAQVDPLPPYLAAWRELDGKRVAIVKVYESADAPHVVKGTGSVYVRTPAGKTAIDGQATLLALAQNARAAYANAQRRAQQSMIVTTALVPPDAPPAQFARGADPANTIVTVRVAPLTVPPHFRDWPVSQAGADAAYRCAATFFPTGADQQDRQTQPRGRGFVVQRVMRDVLERLHVLTLAGDSVGVLGGQLRQPRPDSNCVVLGGLRANHLEPLIYALTGLLATADVVGRVAADTWISLPGDVRVADEPSPPGEHARGELMREYHASADLVVPASDEERTALARRWEREIARNVGIPLWEPRGD
jgi:hypothetical protein